ncbi:MAG: hypothetical protein A2931_01600 [Candidatus Niyogibacteria bacterium RIFCSPLOWO2_01_FULL_45_48]|uniref:Uncharacterized protein n=2 Tax=Candidatus Niyogiibacteriota TaxID=1817912 RepID=A0A1G2EZ89_9BACT|nr:MAG: hypothetical protein A2931_01600 [Candidatus Niyogibacteria bacterium RIFCSPLOWO2_01_FULL_45_48]OGZ29998.1 MAG: hypothetical protein A2835_02945 [Candidatus Niyogibacteria bacterium RIFCSPHIGHO2_01_FULL_45_28]OGZ31063.1 MAG: hypothetical protein A3J00_03165 [Candidatus Niyogibacteria bacterium RIFCSPLOWO2_02_FULL_45_13]
MALKDLFSENKNNGEGTFKCEKCGKEKNKGEGGFVLEGSAFCCKSCCGDTEKGEHKEKKDNVCEFC